MTCTTDGCIGPNMGFVTVLDGTRLCPRCNRPLPEQTGAERYLATRMSDPEYRAAYDAARTVSEGSTPG